MSNLYKTKAAMIGSDAAKQMLSRISAFIFIFLLAGNISGQTTVYIDDFNRGAVVSPLTDGGTPTMVWTTSSTITPPGVSSTNLNSGTDYNALLRNRDASPAAGRTYITGPLSTLLSPFNTTLSSNPGPVTWTFNMKTNRSSSLSGFDNANYGSAVVLVATSSDLISANGYAVVMVKNVTNNAFKLVSFTGGLDANANLTTIIGPSPELAANINWASLKVVYTPATNTWQFYMRDDANVNDPGDPAAGTLTQVGSNTVNTTYTSTVMSHCGFFFNHGGTASPTSNTGRYDNFKVVVAEDNTPTLSATPSTLSNFTYVVGSGPSSSQTYSLSGANLDGSTVTVTGSADFEVSLDNSTFSGSVDIAYTAPTLNATTIYVRLESGLEAGYYNAEMIGNSGGGAPAVNVTCNGNVTNLTGTFTWQGADGADWTVASNWSPSRPTPVSNSDVLLFNDGTAKTITNVTSQTISQLLVSNNTGITLQSGGAVTLTINGGTGDDLTVPAGSALNLDATVAANSILIAIQSGANGLVGGSMTFGSTIPAGVAHKITAVSTNSLVFANNAVFTAAAGFTGNAFGNTNLNSVKFQAGSTYIQGAGSNPFGASYPNTVLTFETGSNYKFMAPTGQPSYSGRTYANFEYNTSLGPVIQGSNPFTCDNLVVTNGTMNFDFSGAITIKGDITIASAGLLNFGKAGNVTNVTLNGSSAQTISGEGLVDFGTNGTLIINNAAGVTLLSKATLQNLNISTGTFTVASGASLITNGTLTGNVKFDRYIGGWTSALHGWHLLSSPVASQAVSPAFTDPTPENYDFYRWDEVNNIWLNQKDPLNNITGFDPGTGYLVAYASSSTKQFNGTPNASNVTVTGLTISGGANSGWNLAGNPFGSALVWNNGTTWTVPGTFAAHAKIWDEAGAAYADIAPGGIIPALNGFMVQVLSGSPASLTIPAAARVHDGTPWYKTEEGMLTLVAYDRTNNTAQQSIIRLDEEATEGYDGAYDSRFLAGYAPQFYSIAGEEQLSTNALPDLNSGRIIEMGFLKNSASEFSIGLKTDNVIQDIEVYLTDKKTGIVTELSKGQEYDFVAGEGDDINRFRLHFGVLGVDDPAVNNTFSIYAYNGMIYVNSVLEDAADITVTNLLGQVVMQHKAAGNSLTEVSSSLLQNGIYMVTVAGNDQVVSKKVIISR